MPKVIRTKYRTITDFTENEYKQQAQNKNFTSIASVMGYKPTANKINYTAMAKNVTAFQKVEVMANQTALLTEYIGGSGNIGGVIVNNCTDYVGSNNFPLLDKKGDFGARLNKAPGAARYIFTRIGENFSKVFNSVDKHILPQYRFEGKDIEYQFMTFNIPMLLVNGSEGMGSGHAQMILSRSVDNMVDYIRAVMNGKKPKKNLFVPHFNGFKGTVEAGEEPNQWIITGLFERTGKLKLKITEVPIGENYKGFIKKMDKLVDAGVIKGYEDLCDPKSDTFLFEVRHDSKFSELSDEEIIEKLKLKSRVTENFTVIDENNRVVRHSGPEDVMKHYMKIKGFFYEKRKIYLIDKLNQDLLREGCKYIFLKGVIDDEIKIMKKSKKEIADQLDKNDKIVEIDGSYDYLTNMSISKLTAEEFKRTYDKIKTIKELITQTKLETVQSMWLDDIKDL